MNEPLSCFRYFKRKFFFRLYAKRANIFSMDKREKLISLKKQTQLTWKAFAEYFGVPYRTMQDWQLGNRDMPAYLLRLMIYKIETDRRFNNEAKPEDKRKDMF